MTMRLGAKATRQIKSCMKNIVMTKTQILSQEKDTLAKECLNMIEDQKILCKSPVEDTPSIHSKGRTKKNNARFKMQDARAMGATGAKL